MTTPAPNPCIPSCGGGSGAPTTVTAGPGAVVTGDPTAGYTVSVPPSSEAGNLIHAGPDGNLSVTCADLAACGAGDTVVTRGPGIVLTGTGDPATPYNISALSSDAGNVLVEGADGGVFLDCTAVSGCVDGSETVVTAGPGATVTGTGTAADPYVVGAAGGGSPTAVTAGPGVDVTGDPVAGYTVSAPPSPDAGNLLTVDANGKHYLDCTAVSGCMDGSETVVTAGPGATVTGTGTAADPYVVGAAAASPAVACGLTGDGSAGAPLALNTGGTAWPWGCDESNGQALYCGADGVVRTEPEKYSVMVWAPAAGPGDIEPGATGTDLDLYDEVLTIVNPSDCREMWSEWVMTVSNFEFTQSPGSDWTVRWGWTVTTDGSVPAPVTVYNGGTLVANRHSSNATFGTHTNYPPVSSVLPMELLTGAPVIPPGGQLSIRVRVNVAFDETNPATVPGDFPPRFGNASAVFSIRGWN